MSTYSIIRHHHRYPMLKTSDKYVLARVPTYLDKCCKAIRIKGSEHSNTVMFSIRYVCHERIIPPQPLSIVEISRIKHFTRIIYFFAGSTLVIRLAVYEQALIISEESKVHLEIYLIPKNRFIS